MKKRTTKKIVAEPAFISNNKVKQALKRAAQINYLGCKRNITDFLPTDCQEIFLRIIKKNNEVLVRQAQSLLQIGG